MQCVIMAPSVIRVIQMKRREEDQDQEQEEEAVLEEEYPEGVLQSTEQESTFLHAYLQNHGSSLESTGYCVSEGENPRHSSKKRTAHSSQD